MLEKLQKHQTERDYLFDNMKAILIFLVVVGHLIVNINKQNPFFEAVYCFIYLFHMPVFIFVTGYFSKNVEKCRTMAVQKYLVPYIVFCILLQAEARLLHLGGSREMPFELLDPQWGMWYLIALFWWKLFLKDIVKIRFVLPVSIALGLLSGFSREFSTYLAVGRTVNFLFFFLLGYYCNAEMIQKIRKIPKWIAVIPVLISGIFSYLMIYRWDWERQLLFLRKHYADDRITEELLARIAVYLLATGMILAFMNLCSVKKRWFSYVGTNSVSIYILHLFVVKLIEKYYGFQQVPYVNFIVIILLSGCITFLFGLPAFAKAYNRSMDWVNRILFRSID